MSATDAGTIRGLLEADRAWSAYALADLEPEEAGRSLWAVDGQAVALLYRGLEPPVLFLAGDPQDAARAASQLPAGPVQFTLQPAARAALGDHLIERAAVPTWRMGLAPGAYRAAARAPAERLGPSDLADLLALFGEHPDRPDAFHSRQLEAGFFYGVRREGRLVCAAGTHIVALRAGVAAIGNVFTAPDWRGRGLAAAATAAAVEALLTAGVRTLVLNVAQHNAAAIRCYRRLGFERHCAYSEGFGYLREFARPGGGGA